MTPIRALEGAPVEGGKLYGVELKPDGSRLYQAATLRISPADEGETAQAVGFSTKAGGREFHLYPLALEPDLSMKLLHFSDYGAYVCCENAPIIIINDNPAEFMPTDWEGQLAQMMGELIRQEREAQLQGEEGDPLFAEKLTAILNSFYIEVIEPMLGRITSDCDFAKANVAKVLSWNRQVALLGLDATFEVQTDAVMSAVVVGMDNCWQKVTKPCVDLNDAEQFGEVVRVARVNQLLGGEPDKYNPNDPNIQCECTDLVNVETWSGSASYSYEQTASDEGVTVQVQRSADFSFQLGTRYESFRDGKVVIIGWRGGTVTGGEEYLRDSYESGSQEPATWTGSGTPKNVGITLEIDTETCVYSFEVQNSQRAIFSNTGVEGVFGQYIRAKNLPLPTASSLSSNMAVPSVFLPGIPLEFNHFEFSSAFASLLARFTNNTFNETQVAWSLTPVE